MAGTLPAWTDTHCHLDVDAYDADREAVIAQAIEAGVQRMLIPALDEGACHAVIALAEQHEAVYAAVGVHPNSANTWTDSTLTALQQYARHPKVVAIGEIGLDYYWDKATPAQQHAVLDQQLNLAAETGLPVVIHNRDATEDTLARLLAWQAGLAADGHPLADRPGVLHSFSGDLSHARQAIEHGFYLGFTGPVTFKKAEDLRALIGALPLERILIETDAPYLTPEPHRGQRNEPAHVCLVGERIAALHGITASRLAAITFDNAARLFEWV